MAENDDDRALRIGKEMDEAADALRQEVIEAADPRLRALLETAAEVVNGLSTTLQHYRQKTEPAWR
jgi:hypothetical protein